MKIGHINFCLRISSIFTVFAFTACTQQLVEMGPPRYENMQDDLTVLRLDTPWEGVVLSLDEMIEIANQRNLDLLVLEQQVLIQDELTGGSVRKWLPQLIWNQELSGRNVNTGSFSQSLDPTVPPAPPSISSQTHVNRLDLTLTWNLLDFGISMVRSRQEANKTLILQMGYEKERQKLIMEIVKNYWKAYATRYSLRANKALFERSQKLISSLRKSVENKVISWADAYRIETDILKNQPELYASELEYNNVIAELAQQMGLPLGSTFELPEEDHLTFATNLLPIEEIEEYALMYRPELYTGDLQEKIKADDVKIAMLSAIPGVAFFAGDFYDTNKFLIYNHWLSAGLRVSWDLFRLPERMSDINIAKMNEDLIVQQRIAFSMAVLTQVRIAYISYFNAIENYQMTKELADAKQKLAIALAKGVVRGDTAESTALTAELDALLTMTQNLRAYGEAMFALERLNNSMGTPRFFVPSNN